MVADQVQDDSSRHELDALWRATQDRLRASVPESTFRLWLEPLQAVGARRATPSTYRRPRASGPGPSAATASLIAEALADSGTALRQVSFAAGARARARTGADRRRSS